MAADSVVERADDAAGTGDAPAAGTEDAPAAAARAATECSPNALGWPA